MNIQLIIQSRNMLRKTLFCENLFCSVVFYYLSILLAIASGFVESCEF